METNRSAFDSRKRKRSSKEGTLVCDRTRELPEVIIQHILSFLPVAAAARTSIISKTWSQAWSSLPNLNFNQFSFLKENPDNGRSKTRFLRFVLQTLQRYLQHDIPVQSLSFSVDWFDTNLTNIFHIWIEASMLIHVKQLHLSIKNFSGSMSQKIQRVLAAKQLITLCIKGCASANNEPRFVCGSVSTINCCSLRSLTLFYIELDESEFHNMLSRCLLIETLVLESCTGLGRIQVQGKFPCLKKFEITALKREMDEVNINAPSLESFIYEVLIEGVRVDCVFRIKLAAPRLKRLKLSLASINDVHLNELLLSSPLLEDLTLNCCLNLERIYVSSCSLKRFSQIFCLSVVEVNLNAPSLLSIQCHGQNTFPSFSFFKGTIPMEGRFVAIPNSVSASLLLKLRDLISNVKHSSIHVAICNEDPSVHIDLEDLRALPIPLGHEVKVLSLHKMAFSSLNYEALVEGFLWACQPKEFTVSSKIDGDIDVVNSLVGKLMARREDLSCCKDDQVKCRSHYFTNVRIKSFQYSQRTDRFSGTFKFCRCRSES